MIQKGDLTGEEVLQVESKNFELKKHLKLILSAGVGSDFDRDQSFRRLAS